MYINVTANSVMLQICALLGFYAAQNGSFFPTCRHNLLVSSSRVKHSLESNFNIYSLRVPQGMKNSGCAPGATVRSEKPSHIGSNFELCTKL